MCIAYNVQFHLNRLMVYECSKSNRDIDPVLFEFQHKKLVPVLLQVHVVKSTRTYLYLCTHRYTCTCRFYFTCMYINVKFSPSNFDFKKIKIMCVGIQVLGVTAAI
jgi:hypothetical protein